MTDTHPIFRPIPIRFDVREFESLRGQHSITFAETFREYKFKSIDQLIEVLDRIVQFNIRPTTVNITDIHSPGVHPHIDHWPVALNFYLSAGGERTMFYKQPDQSVKSEGPSYKAFELEDLVPDCSFVAEQGSCWLLNTHIPHSVEVPEPGTKRTMLRLAWASGTFEEIYRSIRPLNR